MDRTAGVILAGGRASRFGRGPKGLIELTPGETLIDRLVAEMSAAGLDEIVISANDPVTYRRFGIEVLPDLRKGVGPLGGIEAGLAWGVGKCEGILFCPCDLPGITRREFSALLDAFRGGRGRLIVAETGLSFRQPLCSIVHNGLLDDVRRALDAGERGVGDLWDRLGATPVHFDDETPFHNVNTPQDLARWRSRREKP